jgi:hypothetical protein
MGLLHVRSGRHARAREWFERCAASDPLAFSVHLTTKTTEALFWSGWLAFTAGDRAGAESAWKQGLAFGDRLTQRPLAETFMQPDAPNLFDYGDGMRELIYALENVARCANGIHCLRLLEQGVSVRWDLIHNCFRFQRETINRALRVAQDRVARLCGELAQTRGDLALRTAELDRTRLELQERTAGLDREREALRERGRELEEARELLTLRDRLQSTNSAL